MSTTADITAPASPTTPATAASPISAAPTTPITPTTPATSEPAPIDTGIPGLDSEDAFCAAWSRFGGSWQVAIGAAAFGAPDEAARLEVIASTVVADAYDAVFAAWPAELEDEREVVADEFFGAFRRRSDDASAALAAAGATPAQQTTLAEIWVDALAARDPSNPVLTVDLPADLAPLVDDATARFIAQRPPFTQDPSMVITAETPLTDAYLGTACPDQGSIFGGEA